MATPGGAGVLLGTSGTSGAPKVVFLSEQQLAHVAAGVARHHRLGPGDRGLSPLPLFHVNAEVVGVLATLAARATLVVDDRFHRTGFWSLVEARRITWINAVPAIISVLASTPGPVASPGRVRFVRSASAPLGTATLARFERLTGLGVLETYGMTEAASMITANPLEGRRKPGSVGLPVGTELRVVGPTGQARPTGVLGQVEIRGRGTITSYAVGGNGAFDDGWLGTGDLGHLDEDGYLYLVGRADDVINRGGENIYPREVEEVLLADPRVEAALVVGVPDPVLGARPVAYVVLAEAASAAVDTPAVCDQGGEGRARAAADLRAHCQGQLSPFKVPAQVHVVEQLPVGPTGKVSRRLVGAGTAMEAAGP